MDKGMVTLSLLGLLLNSALKSCLKFFVLPSITFIFHAPSLALGDSLVAPNVCPPLLYIKLFICLIL